MALFSPFPFLPLFWKSVAHSARSPQSRFALAAEKATATPWSPACPLRLPLLRLTAQVCSPELPPQVKGHLSSPNLGLRAGPHLRALGQGAVPLGTPIASGALALLRFLLRTFLRCRLFSCPLNGVSSGAALASQFFSVSVGHLRLELPGMRCAPALCSWISHMHTHMHTCMCRTCTRMHIRVCTRMHRCTHIHT